MMLGDDSSSDSELGSKTQLFGANKSSSRSSYFERHHNQHHNHYYSDREYQELDSKNRLHL